MITFLQPGDVLVWHGLRDTAAQVEFIIAVRKRTFDEVRLDLPAGTPRPVILRDLSMHPITVVYMIVDGRVFSDWCPSVNDLERGNANGCFTLIRAGEEENE